VRMLIENGAPAAARRWFCLLTWPWAPSWVGKIELSPARGAHFDKWALACARLTCENKCFGAPPEAGMPAADVPPCSRLCGVLIFEQRHSRLDVVHISISSWFLSNDTVNLQHLKDFYLMKFNNLFYSLNICCILI
jgi:hypothetical protein